MTVNNHPLPNDEQEVKKAKIFFRLRYKDRRTSPYKICASIRKPGAKHPKQIYLGYIPESKSLSAKKQHEIEKVFCKKWEKEFPTNYFPGIDWKDAEHKLEKLYNIRSIALEPSREPFYGGRRVYCPDLCYHTLYDYVRSTRRRRFLNGVREVSQKRGFLVRPAQRGTSLS
jgi:hypothetical protein